MQLDVKRWRLFGRAWDIWQVLVCVLVCVHVLVIVATFTDYGITIDEPPQAQYGQEIVRWYTSLFQYEAFFEQIKVLDLERYGGFFDTVLYPITQLSPLDVYETRHLCYALLGLIGVVGVYYLGATLGTSATGFLAALFLVLTPRFFAHTFNNPKDLPFAIFYLWSIYFLVRCLQKLPSLSMRLMCATGVVIGLTLGTRVGGLILFGYLGLFFGLRYVQVIQAEVNVAGLVTRIVKQVGAIVVIAWVVMLIFWPTAQRSPILFPIDALLNFSQYGTPDFTTTFFEGKRIDINEVPWYYAPRWFLLALPEFLFLGLIAGVGFLFFKGRALLGDGLWFTQVKLEWVLLAFAGFFPLVYVVVIGTPLYDGLRHFLFVIPPLVILSAAGVEALVRAISVRWMQWGLVGAVGVLVGLTFWDMVRLHPNQGVYFNRLFAGGLAEASKLYQTDYWENSHKQGVRWLEAHYEKERPGRKWRIAAGGSNIQYALDAERFSFASIPVEADFYVSITRDDRHKMVPGEIVHKVERDGVALLYIIRPDNHYAQDAFFADSEARDIHLAWQYLQVEAFEKSLATYARVLKNDPKNPMVYHNVAYAHYRLGHHKEAVDFGQRALVLKPDYLKARLFLGHALLASGDAKGAVAAYKEVLKNDTGDAEVYRGLARGLQKLGQVDAAIVAFKAAIKLAPKDVAVHRDLGALLAEQSRFVEASDVLQVAASLDSTQAVTWYMLAQTRRLSGALDLAHDHIKWAVQLNGSVQDYRVEHLNVGRAYERQGDVDGAVSVYQTAIKLTPDFPEAYIHLGVLCFKKRQYNEAVSIFEQAVSVLPQDPRMQMGLAQGCELSGQVDKAIAAYRKVLSMVDSPEVQASLDALLARAN